MVAVVAPVEAGVRERVVEQEMRNAVDRVNELVEARDLARSAFVAGRPREHVGHRDRETLLPPALDHRLEVPSCLLDRALLSDVVDPALDDEKFSAENRATMESWLDKWTPVSVAAGRAMQPIWSQPGEKVIRFEDSLEHAKRRFDDLLGALNLNTKDLD